MKQVELLKTQKHSRGNIEKGSVYNWNESTGFYEFSQNGRVVSTVNEAGVNAFSTLFKKLNEKL
jgi:hypothetical protein